jgi:hypothetical protein
MQIRLLVFHMNAKLGFVDFTTDSFSKKEAVEKAKKILTKHEHSTHGRIVLPDATEHLVTRPA